MGDKTPSLFTRTAFASRSRAFRESAPKLVRCSGHGKINIWRRKRLAQGVNLRAATPEILVRDTGSVPARESSPVSRQSVPAVSQTACRIQGRGCA